jgi:hypothetical protein
MNNTTFNNTIIKSNQLGNNILLLLFIGIMIFIISCYIILCIFIIIKKFIAYCINYDYYYNNNNKNNITYIYDILFGSVSTPIIINVITTKIDNNL